MATKAATSHEEDNSPQLGTITLNVVTRVHVPIRASRTGKATYGQLLDEALVNHFKSDQGNSTLQGFNVELSEDAQWALRDAVNRGRYGSDV